jgi:hypothetical protein
MIIATLLALSLAADPPPRTDQVKDLVKSEPKNGLDVSKLPFTPESIKQVVMSFQPQIQTCYEEHLAAKNKAVEGSLKTAFTITAEGFVKNAKVNAKTSTLKDKNVHSCVVTVLSAMEFPKPPDGKDHPIEFPFNLKAQQ